MKKIMLTIMLDKMSVLMMVGIHLIAVAPIKKLVAPLTSIMYTHHDRVLIQGGGGHLPHYQHLTDIRMSALPPKFLQMFILPPQGYTYRLNTCFAHGTILGSTVPH